MNEKGCAAMKTTELFDLEHTLAGAFLAQFAYPWQALQGIRGLILSIGEGLGEEYEETSPSVWIHKAAKIAPSAHISGPCIIGANTQVRHCAFIRGSALVGENCVVGNSTELKNVILFDGVQVPHFNYVGDSILGYKAHLGAGAVTSNVKSDKSLVVVDGMETGLKKFGAMIGDFAEVGCNAVLNPGTIIGRNCTIYPATCVRGVVPGNSIWKTGGVIVRKEER
jgi:NDP-sugar pyrophosphorylase family protein